MRNKALDMVHMHIRLVQAMLDLIVKYYVFLIVTVHFITMIIQLKYVNLLQNMIPIT